MRNLHPVWKKFLKSSKVVISTFTATFLICQSAHTYAGELAQQPLFASKPVIPLMMLNMSKDHQLYFKAYDDYSDLTGPKSDGTPGGDPDGKPETTYLHTYDYYGYFDSKKCYYYDTTNHLFKPGRWANPADNYCNHPKVDASLTADKKEETARVGQEWSGNFLNWASMTRMDTIRKILYGGMRASGGDTNSGYTVLERAFLPNDAHSFAKYYNGADLEKLVGVSSGSFTTSDTDLKKNGITICNTTPGSSGLSQNSTEAPKMVVAKGNFSLWASNERFQCRWAGTSAGQAQHGNATRGLNGNTTDSEINAYSNSPSEADDGIGEKNYTVRVQVCDASFIDDTFNNEKCKKYGSYYKPEGKLQSWGLDDQIHFGLLTGSYAKNKSGGVVRKNIGSFTDEVNSSTGQFILTGGIVDTINRLRIYGYRFDNGTYFGVTDSDDCSWGITSFSNGDCSNWGNPQSEIFLESLRYLAGLGKSADFATTNDSSYISGLPAPDWTDPVNSTSKNTCAPLNVLQFNASVSSYDHDQINTSPSNNADGIAGKVRPSGSGVTIDVDAQTNLVGTEEGIDGKPFFIADNGSSNDGLCNSKILGTLAKVTGICPEAPRLGASYKMAGLAYFANIYGVSPDRETVKTFGVSLQPSIPSISIPVPGSAAKAITLLPACRNTFMDPDANCAIVDFKVVSGPTLSSDGTKNEGTLYVNWEDSEQGGDYDQDMWGVIQYSVSSTTATITTDVIAQSTGNSMGFGYVIGGTLQDGFHAHSGINSYTYDDIGTDDCASGCTTANIASSQTYDVGTSTTGTLKNPLFYAAKWGGFESKVKDPDNASKFLYPTKPESGATWDKPNTYLHVTDPHALESALDEALGEIAETVGSASAVATNSTRVDGERLVYQARFKSDKWSGQVVAFQMDANGDVKVANSDGTSAAVWDTDKTVGFPSDHSTRKVYTHNESTGVEFLWANLSSTQQTTFQDTDSVSTAQLKVNWIRGDRDKEDTDFRKRNVLIGDIVNSDPAYAGQQKYPWYKLPVTYETDGITVKTDTYGATTYRNYVADKKKPDARVPMLLVGANDGMLHVLNADKGTELFSYVPRGVLGKLNRIPNKNYTSQGKHTYTMDGSVFIGDVYDASHPTQKWRTYAAATLGAGGKGVFVLDITDIDKDGNGFNPATHVILDWTEKELPNMGNVLSRPIIAPMKDGNWYLIFGNGLENTIGKSELVLINLSDASKTVITKEVSASSGGLSAPALLPDQDGVIIYAYAGDLSGNIWKFDLSDTSTAKWDVAYGGAPFVTLRDKDNKPQPITAAPTLGLRFANGSIPAATMVYVGTGRYLYSSDNVPKSDVQSFYGLADEEGANKPLSDLWKTIADRNTVLHKKEISKEEFSVANGRSIREIKGEGRFTTDPTDTKVNWASKKGWYLDLIPPASTAQGEMVVSKPLLLYDRVLFPTLIPSDLPCETGGRGWIMDLSALGDRYDTTHRVLPESGLSMDDPAMSLSEAIESGENLYIPVSNIKGEIDVIKGKVPVGAAKGRMSWRQIK